MWFGRKAGVVPVRCPSRACRKLASKGHGNENTGRKAVERRVEDQPIERKVSEPADMGGVEGDSIPGVSNSWRGEHIKSCRLYGCLMCKALGHKDKGRGL